MKKFLSWKFLVTLIISFLVFEGLEHLIHELFNIDLEHYLSLGGAGIWLILGLKFHVICCAIPMLGATIYCTHKGQKHCNHDHEN